MLDIHDYRLTLHSDKRQRAKDVRIAFFYPDGNKFADYLRRHLAREPSWTKVFDDQQGCWEKSFSRPLSECKEISQVSNGSKELQRIYDVVRKKLEEGMDYAAEEPLWIWAIEERTPTARGQADGGERLASTSHRPRQVRLYYFLARYGYKIVAVSPDHGDFDAVVISAFFLSKNPGDTLYTLFQEAWESIRARAWTGNEYPDDETTHEHVKYLEVEKYSVRNWTVCPNPYRDGGSGPPPSGGTPSYSFHLQAYHDYRLFYLDESARREARMSIEEAGYHLLQHAGMLLREEGDRRAVDDLAAVRSVERKDLAGAACRYAAGMNLADKLGSLGIGGAPGRDELEEARDVLVQRDALETVLEVARDLVHDQLGANEGLRADLAQARWVAAAIDDQVLAQPWLRNLRGSIGRPTRAAGGSPLPSSWLDLVLDASTAAVRGVLEPMIQWVREQGRAVTLGGPAIEASGMQAESVEGSQHLVMLLESPNPPLLADVEVTLTSPSAIRLVVELAPDDRLRDRLPAPFRAFLVPEEARRRLGQLVSAGGHPSPIGYGAAAGAGPCAGVHEAAWVLSGVPQLCGNLDALYRYGEVAAPLPLDVRDGFTVFVVIEARQPTGQ